MYYKRAHLETKKQYYKRLAQIKKNKWLKYHNLSEEDLIKSPYIPQEDLIYEEEEKSKRIVKGQIRIQQKLRNRAAAQQSRQRHRCYVAELEKKVKIYEEMLQKQGALCKNCKRSLLSQTNINNESIVVQEFSDHSLSLKFFNSNESQNDIVNSFLNDQIIRIDNKDASTPFGIFFIICLIGVLAIFGLRTGSSDTAPSLLANFQSTFNHHIQMQNMPSHQKYHVQLQPNLIQMSAMQISQNQQKYEQQKSLDNLEFTNMAISHDNTKSISTEQSKDDFVKPSLKSKQEILIKQRDSQLLLIKSTVELNQNQSHQTKNTDSIDSVPKGSLE